ncbi:MAG: NAD-dependent epimerase/dehydratase family protein [Thermoanaerobaculia bacterium]
MRILITGAAGNLATFLARALLESPHQLRLMTHRTELAPDLRSAGSVEIVRADLGDPATLAGVCAEVDCIVHLAGVLFAPRPASFLSFTNVTYVDNILRSAIQEGVGKFILISFPHVEGDTTPAHPATGRLDATPPSVHARTRLAAERLMIELAAGSTTTPIILRSGTIYGSGVLMIEVARRLMHRRLLAVWREPTWYHWLALPDFLSCVRAAIEREGVRGIYHLGDDVPLTLQDGLDRFAAHWGTAKPLRLPRWTFYAAAAAVEAFALVTGSTAPLHRDFIRIGMVSHVGDTSRMKQELLPHLAYPSLDEGISLLSPIAPPGLFRRFPNEVVVVGERHLQEHDGGLPADAPQRVDRLLT